MRNVVSILHDVSPAKFDLIQPRHVSQFISTGFDFSFHNDTEIKRKKNSDGVASLWQEIHLLEDRVDKLANALEISQKHIAKTEENYQLLQRQGDFSNMLIISRFGNRLFDLSLIVWTVYVTCCFACYSNTVETLLDKKCRDLPLDADIRSGVGSKLCRQKRTITKTLIFFSI